MRGMSQLLRSHFAALAGGILMAALSQTEPRLIAVTLFWFAAICIAIGIRKDEVATPRATSQE